MEDVARAAKVSMSTVSHVLNGTRKVSPATVAAVRDAIRKTGYVPNTLAQALAGAASRTIGVAISALTNHYFSGVVRAIEAECARRGLMMFLADTHDDPAQELRVIQALHQRRVDGIILAPAAGSERQVVDSSTRPRSRPYSSTASPTRRSIRSASRTCGRAKRSSPT